MMRVFVAAIALVVARAASGLGARTRCDRECRRIPRTRIRKRRRLCRDRKACRYVLGAEISQPVRPAFANDEVHRSVSKQGSEPPRQAVRSVAIAEPRLAASRVTVSDPGAWTRDRYSFQAPVYSEARLYRAQPTSAVAGHRTAPCGPSDRQEAVTVAEACDCRAPLAR